MIWDAIAGGVKGLGDTILGVIKEFHTDPETLMKMEQAVRQAQMDFERQVMDMERQDRDSARRREIETKDSHTPSNLAYIAIGSFICLAGWVIIYGVPTESRDMVFAILGWITGFVGSAFGYYFGSSKETSKSVNFTSTKVER
jgi:hypothetical protein